MHETDDVDENHGESQKHCKHRLRIDDEDGNDHQTCRQRHRNVSNGFCVDGFVLFIVQPTSAVGENFTVVVAAHGSNVSAQGIHRRDRCLRLDGLDVVTMYARGCD